LPGDVAAFGGPMGDLSPPPPPPPPPLPPPPPPPLAAAAAAAEEEEKEEAETPPKKKAKKAVTAEDDNAAPEKEVETPAKVTGESAATASDPNPEFRLFVGGLAYCVTEDVLRKDFAECGEIADIKLLLDRETGDSRGIAFLTMADKAGYEAALKFDGQEYAGRTINVSKANSDGKGKGKGKDKGKGKGKDGKGKSKGKGKGPSVKPPDCTSVVVKGLAYAVTSDDLQACFQKCGNGPKNVNLLKDMDTGESRGMAFVDFDDTAAVDEAMKLTETNLKGRAFFMDYSTPREW